MERHCDVDGFTDAVNLWNLIKKYSQIALDNKSK